MDSRFSFPEVIENNLLLTYSKPSARYKYSHRPQQYNYRGASKNSYNFVKILRKWKERPIELNLGVISDTGHGPKIRGTVMMETMPNLKLCVWHM